MTARTLPLRLAILSPSPNATGPRNLILPCRIASCFLQIPCQGAMSALCYWRKEAGPEERASMDGRIRQSRACKAFESLSLKNESRRKGPHSGWNVAGNSLLPLGICETQPPDRRLPISPSFIEAAHVRDTCLSLKHGTTSISAL